MSHNDQALPHRRSEEAVKKSVMRGFVAMGRIFFKMEWLWPAILSRLSAKEFHAFLSLFRHPLVHFRSYMHLVAPLILSLPRVAASISTESTVGYCM